MTCSCRNRSASTTSSSSMRRNSSRSSLSDEVNCTFSNDSREDRFYRNKQLKLEVGKLLGSGGFGSVFEGKCSGRKIAVKRLHNNIKNPNAIKESFQAERAVMSLKHRNVVRVLATTTTSKEFKSDNFVIMEYAGHRNLLSVLNDEREKITTLGRIRYAADIASALHYIHKLKIVHLDVKPANIMVTVNNTCKLGDFGCCKVLPDTGPGSPTTPTNSNLTGTLAYTSPELLKGEFPTCKADIYSFGICLWQLLTREKPYGNENLYVVIFGVVSYKLRPTITMKQELENKSYVNLVKSLWKPNPDDRPTAQQIMLRLRSLRKRQKSPEVHPITKARWRI